MSKGDLLRAIYDDKNATWYIHSDHRIASRIFKTDSSGNVYVEYVNRDGIRLASAHEIHRYGKYPCVEFRDKDGSVTGHAYLDVNTIGDPNVSYYNYVGDKVGEAFFPKKRLEGILEDYYRETGVTKPKPDKKPDTKAEDIRRPREPDVPRHAVDISADFEAVGTAIPGILMVGAFIGVAFNILFSALYSHLDTLVHYGGIVCIFASCPVMTLLHLLICRIPGDSTREVRRFRSRHILLSGFCFAALAAVQSIAYYDVFPGLTARFAENTAFGFYHFLLCFAPLMVYGLFSAVWTILRRRKEDIAICMDFSFDSMLFMVVGSCILVGITQMIMLAGSYRPGDFGMTVTMILAVPFLALLICLAALIGYLPYRILSNFF